MFIVALSHQPAHDHRCVFARRANPKAHAPIVNVARGPASAEPTSNCGRYAHTLPWKPKRHSGHLCHISGLVQYNLGSGAGTVHQNHNSRKNGFFKAAFVRGEVVSLTY